MGLLTRDQRRRAEIQRRSTRRLGTFALPAVIGVACSQLLGPARVDDESPVAASPEPPAADGATAAAEAVNPEAPAEAADDGALGPRLARLPSGEPASADPDVPAPDAIEADAVPVLSVSRADWRAAANAADWETVAEAIDALPDPEQKEPAVRYARAIAARELGQLDLAIECLEGLELQLPLLAGEIREARAECQAEVGPYDPAVRYFKELRSPEGLMAASQALFNAEKPDAARHQVERAFTQIRNHGRETQRGRRNEIRARELRARIAEAQGQLTRASRDWLWLATNAPTDERALDADREYERVSKEKLTKSQRLDRALAFSREGLLEPVQRELSLMESAPGEDPDAVNVTSALAFAYYRSRKDYERAAELFRQASELSKDGRVKHRFFAARALSRAHFDDEAIVEYAKLAKDYPGTGFAERAVFRIASLHYGMGRWKEAEKAYDEYLKQYRNGGRFISSSRYERAIAQLGSGQHPDQAEESLRRLAERTRDPEQKSLLHHLRAVALETANTPEKTKRAIERYREVIADYPLSFAAMASSARLARLGQPDAHRSRLATDLGDAERAKQKLADLELPDKAKLLAEIGLRTDAEIALFEERHEVKERYSDNKSEALCSLYQSLDRGYRSYSLAYVLLQSKRLGGAPREDNLWAWRCAFPTPYRELVEDVEQRYDLPNYLVHSVMRQESAFRPNVESPVGAVGLMQLMPYTARRVANEIQKRPGAPWVPNPSEPKNVLNNLEMGGFYLSKLMRMMKHQTPLAVASYNAGPRAVSRWLEGGEDLPIDVWVARIPYRETRGYVAKVMGNYLAYRYLDDPANVPDLELDLIPGTRADPGAY